MDLKKVTFIALLLSSSVGFAEQSDSLNGFGGTDGEGEPSLEQPNAGSTEQEKDAVKKQNADKVVKTDTPQSQQIGSTLGAARNPGNSSLERRQQIDEALDESADQQTLLQMLAASGLLGKNDLFRAQQQLANELTSSANSAAGSSTSAATSTPIKTGGFSSPQVEDVGLIAQAQQIPTQRSVDSEPVLNPLKAIDLSIPDSAIVRPDGTSVAVTVPGTSLMMDPGAKSADVGSFGIKANEKSQASTEKDQMARAGLEQTYQGNQALGLAQSSDSDKGTVLIGSINLSKIKKGIKRSIASNGTGKGPESIISDPIPPKATIVAAPNTPTGPNVTKAPLKDSCWIDFFDKSWMQRCFPTQLAGLARIKVPKSIPPQQQVNAKPKHETIALSLEILLAVFLVLLWIEERWIGIVRRIWYSVGVATGLHVEAIQVVELSNEYANRMRCSDGVWRVFTIHSTSKKEIEIGTPIDGGVYPARWFSPSLLISLEVEDISERVMFKKKKGMSKTQEPLNCALRPNQDHVKFLKASGLVKERANQEVLGSPALRAKNG